MMKPFTPKEAKENKIFPPQVIEAVNTLISENYVKGSFNILQSEVVSKILNLFERDGIQVCSNDLFKKHWLDFEDCYRKYGWNVIFDKPAYNESYQAFWTFTEL